MNTFVHENVSAALVNVWTVFPTCIAKKDGGTTQKTVPKTNVSKGIPTIGAHKFINQLGKIGVILKKIIK